MSKQKQSPVVQTQPQAQAQPEEQPTDLIPEILELDSVQMKSKPQNLSQQSPSPQGPPISIGPPQDLSQEVWPETSLSPEEIEDAEDIRDALKELELESVPLQGTTLTSKEFELCDEIREYCTEHGIALVLKQLCQEVPEALPNYRTWSIQDPIPYILREIKTVGYVEKVFPALRVMLTNNIGNISWTSRVLIAMTVYRIVEELSGV